MSQRFPGTITPPFAFPAIVGDAAFGRPRGVRIASAPPFAAEPGPARADICPATIVVSGLFLDAVDRRLATLTVMDFGAGDGRCGRLLARHGAATLIAVDPAHSHPRPAALPGVYADRIVGDLTALGPAALARLDRHRFDALISAAGLGVRGPAPSEFVEALEYLAPGAVICVALDAAVLGERDASGYGALIRALSVRGVIDVETLIDVGRRVRGSTREYVALLARKRRPVYDA